MPRRLVSCPECGGRMKYTRAEARRWGCVECGARRGEKVMATPDMRAKTVAQREHHADYMRTWREDPDNARAQVASSERARRANLEAQRMRAAARRARKAGNFVEDVHPLVVLERDDGVCGICADDVDPFDFHVDHVIPLMHGGEHSYANAQTSHPLCNIKKGVRLAS